MEENRKFININLIESVKYFPKKEYEFYQIVKEGEVKHYFLGLFKKKIKKDLYYFNDLDTVIREELSYPIELDKVSEYLNNKNNRLYLDSDKKIYYKPFFKVKFSSGKTEIFWAEDFENAEKFIKEFKNNINFIEIELW